MKGLENFGLREIAQLLPLIHAYAYAGSFAKDYTNQGRTRYFIPLSDNWYENKVMPYYSNLGDIVMLINDDHQAVKLTDIGAMMLYCMPYNGQEGDLFDLSDLFIDECTDAGKHLPIKEWHQWHIDDARVLFECIERDKHNILTHPDTGENNIQLAQDCIAYSFIDRNLPKILAEFKANNEDWHFQLASSANDPYSEDDWYEIELADGFVQQALKEIGLSEFSDFDKYAEYIRIQMLRSNDETKTY